jgi:hypothetical protein
LRASNKSNTSPIGRQMTMLRSICTGAKYRPRPPFAWERQSEPSAERTPSQAPAQDERVEATIGIARAPIRGCGSGALASRLDAVERLVETSMLMRAVFGAAFARSSRRSANFDSRSSSRRRLALVNRGPLGLRAVEPVTLTGMA